MIGILHVFVHLAAALILMLALELGVETFVRHKLLATSGKFFLSLMCYIQRAFFWLTLFYKLETTLLYHHIDVTVSINFIFLKKKKYKS